MKTIPKFNIWLNRIMPYFIIMMILLAMCAIYYEARAVTVPNKKPVPQNDTIRIKGCSVKMSCLVFSVDLIKNDFDVDKKKVITFRVGTVDHKANEIAGISEKMWLTVRSNGLLSIVVFPGWNGIIDFSYVVNDYKPGAGRRGYVRVINTWTMGNK